MTKARERNVATPSRGFGDTPPGPAGLLGVARPGQNQKIDHDRFRPDAPVGQDLDARHHLHPFTIHHELAGRRARVISRAEGCYVWDSEGNQIFDGMAGLWCTQVGHGRERLARIAYDQIRTLDYYNAFFQCGTPPAIELTTKLAELLPAGMDRLHFVNSGSEANDTVVKSVWYYWNLLGKPNKKQFISRNLGYHGVGLGSASLTGMKFMHEQFDLPLPRFHHIGNPFLVSMAKGCPRATYRSSCRCLRQARGHADLRRREGSTPTA